MSWSCYVVHSGHAIGVNSHESHHRCIYCCYCDSVDPFSTHQPGIKPLETALLSLRLCKRRYWSHWKCHRLQADSRARSIQEPDRFTFTADSLYWNRPRWPGLWWRDSRQRSLSDWINRRTGTRSWKVNQLALSPDIDWPRDQVKRDRSPGNANGREYQLIFPPELV